MKKIVLPIALVTLLATSIFVSCSDDSGQTDISAKRTELILKNNTLSNDDFVKGFYPGASYAFGNSITTKDESGTELIVTKVVVDSDLRGYVVNRTSDNKLLYFADFDKSNDKMTSVDVQTNETEVMTGLSANEYYLESGSDVFPIIEAANNTTTFGFFAWVKWTFTMDHFWGHETDKGPCHNEEIGGTFQSVQDITVSHRVFWIRWSSPKQFTDVPC